MNLITLIETVGYAGLFGIIFAESGLLFGVVFPGDSLLFTAGFLASQKLLNILVLLPLCFVAAVGGDSAGYWFGRKIGPKLFNKEDSIFFHKDNLTRASAFYEKHGGKALILARFMPVIRTLVPIVAGIGQMHYRTFIFFNIIGGLLWSAGMLLLGFTLGSVIPNIDRYLLPIIALIILLSIAPSIYHLFRKEERPKTFALIRQIWTTIITKISARASAKGLISPLAEIRPPCREAGFWRKNVKK